MPRGNDSADASKELAERYKTSGNAEDLIRSNRLRRPRALNRASLRRRDDTQTGELDFEKVASAADLPEGSTVLDAAVRGGDVTYVAELPNKQTVKGVLEKKGNTLKTIDLEPDEAAENATARVDAEVSKAGREAQAEAEVAVAEAREKAQDKAREQAEKAREAAEKDAEAAQKAAEKADAA